MSKSFGLLDEVVAVLSARPSMRVRIEGHTDIRGTHAYNVRLSQARADSVMAYLVGKGISSDRMEAKGMVQTSRSTTTRRQRAANATVVSNS